MEKIRPALFDDFNSSMVRLKAFVFYRITGRDFKFQFQYGAIEGGVEEVIEATVKAFQFQYGAIEGKKTNVLTNNVYHFNSSMVRLKATGMTVPHSLPVFQFQYGAIEGETGYDVYPIHIDFNSSMVRLKAIP